jgi:ABC-type lipoprotein release transport system permease subunit
MKQIRYAIGCDLRIATPEKEPMDLAQNFTSDYLFSANITEVMPVLHVYGLLAGRHVKIIGVNPAAYLEIGFWVADSFVNTSATQALTSLANDPNGAIISRSDAETLGLGVNDAITIESEGVVANHTIVGVLTSAPGFGIANPERSSIIRSIGFQEPDRFLLVNKDAPLFVSQAWYHQYKTNLFFAKVEEGVEEAALVETLSRLLEEDTVYSPMTYNPGLYRSLYLQGATGILNIQLMMSIVIGIVIETFLIGYITSKKSREYAVMRAVGATRRDITIMIFVEVIAMLSFSTATGLLVGFLYSKVLFDLLLAIFPFASIVPYALIVPPLTIAVSFGVIIAAMLVISYSTAKKAGRTEVARLLRNL